MTTDQIEQFQQQIAQDQTLQARIAAINTRDDLIRLVLEIGKEQGYTFTDDEVQHLVDELSGGEAVEELTEDELESVAGGFDQQLFGRRTLRCY